MSSSKEYKQFILEQLSLTDNITCKPMMGEFLLYCNNILFGGIYDNRLLIQIVGGNKKSSTRKYICPCCGMSVRATRFVNVVCLDCNEPLILAA